MFFAAYISSYTTFPQHCLRSGYNCTFHMYPFSPITNHPNILRHAVWAHETLLYELTIQAMYVLHNTDTRSCENCCPIKATSITCSECVSVALLMHHAMRMHHIVICVLPGPATQRFPHGLTNSTIFGKKFVKIKCVYWFYLQVLSEIFLIPSTIQRDIIINVPRSSCKVPVIRVFFQ
jgi:hypothetical protein